ncbi:FXSXX-COOH protein [Thermomonospora echinospora]|uniref:FXSXX-COOH protein n=1 Tax=Thermomonospora echinospora TaxID=1992 RepID=A0A1H5XYE0_9ACTN|nr:FxSxx-COOH cyclophane-containing RiPP peptide [Thermomonospora echinospora]SEG16370.1 FXSXX-COOH protein [Thermomonospora echinospora]
MDDADGEIESMLIDLGGLSLREIRALDGTVLGEALARVRSEAADPREVVAGFDSNMPPAAAEDVASVT